MRYWKNMLVVGVTIFSLASPSVAYYDPYDDSQSHPLRLVAYALHPVGFALEWLILRPIHALVSQPELEPVFGHTPHGFQFSPTVPRVSEPTALPSGAPSVKTTVDIETYHSTEAAEAAADEAKRAADEAARAADKATRAFEKSLQK